ncbi:DNA repair protein RadA [Hyphobacterium sp. HN65]|uniref:DNA repair protein RadA n=1 Tax=Hyphobacterium lacteum TaxID=3116575 RepID=A0ABU7LN58_9PROT|nr:DNA repair protein RadA [Hyphobacterium sp. HN65]MEE2524759.1 DNA repair protein RadA [Hyphobacterium sp. HN65]
MARGDSQFVCQSCGAVHAKWAGQCADCGSWNTLVEEIASAPLGTQAKPRKAGRRGGLELLPLQGEGDEPPRHQSGVAEFDRVCGGGLVPGSALLVGGDPGIGKSTLLLQAVAQLAGSGAKSVYVSGEEAIDQVRSRARRLGLSDRPVALAAETSLENILDGLKSEKPDIAVIDSVQTLWSDQLAAAPGTVAQVRACAQELVRFAKKSGCAVILVGHVTKDGQIAGPRVVEHMVDAVLYFEGDRSHQFRILRAVKNRFGPTDEIGVFEMGDAGLREVENPSALFLNDRGDPTPGSAVFAGMEGTRPVLTEIQALVAASPLGTPRRTVVGWDSGRMSMVLAVLEARCGLSFGGRDVYLNVAGGLKIGEPAADLAVAAAIVSSALNAPIPADAVVFGEISLSGDIRAVGRNETRLKEAAKLGFSQALAPMSATEGSPPVTVRGLSGIGDLVTTLSAWRLED